LPTGSIDAGREELRHEYGLLMMNRHRLGESDVDAAGTLRGCAGRRVRPPADRDAEADQRQTRDGQRHPATSAHVTGR
jgi:hypothetical protein